MYIQMYYNLIIAHKELYAKVNEKNPTMNNLR